MSGGDFRLSQLLRRNAMKCLFLSSGQPRAHHCHSNATNASPGQQDPWRTNSWWRRALFRALMADKVYRTTQYTCLQPRQRSHSFKTFHPRMVSLLAEHWFSIVCCTMKVSCKGPKNTKKNKIIYVLRIFWLNSTGAACCRLSLPGELDSLGGTF